jgi:hypothetical protein
MGNTPSEMLTKIDQTISDIVTGKASVRQFNGRSYTYLDLDKLRTMRREYQNLSNASEISGGDKRPFKMIGMRMRETK